MTLEQTIDYFMDDSRSIAEVAESDEASRLSAQYFADYYKQVAEWLKILKKAKFEYDEAWRIITHPTPDVTSYDKNRAQVILETFRGSLGKMEERAIVKIARF